MSKKQDVTVRVEMYSKATGRTKVIEDMLLSTALANRKHGWVIKDPIYDERGILKTAKKETIEVKTEVKEEVKKPTKEEYLEQNKDAGIDAQIEKISNMRSVEKLEKMLQNEDLHFKVKLAITNKINKLNE